MSELRNRIGKEDALKKLSQETFQRKTVSFYRYVIIKDPQAMRDKLWQEWNDLGVLGRIYVAHEGINAQINVPEPVWNEFVEKLHARKEFSNIPFKVAVEEKEESFWKLTIKVKKQIVADGLTENEYDVTNVGTHLNPEEFHKAMEDENAVVVDMRNHYESRIGKFENALTPDSDTFRDELPMVKKLLKGQKDKKVLLYCTGGIRCEKASAYLKHNGFEDVSQLYGGIINYAHEIKKTGKKSKFIGKNFVFDDRVDEAITNDVLSQCDQCDVSSDRYVNCKNMTCNTLFIQCAGCEEKMNRTCSTHCQKIAALPLDEQKRKRAGVKHTFKRYRQQIRPKKYQNRLFGWFRDVFSR
ncbi:MAG: rhodanese-related sulfurtransferase [Candidatus Gracilibacteria bacterium]|nr:rhodanese-related sulfurtransferase [Candidatus Gracilibacteria bacterium]